MCRQQDGCPWYVDEYVLGTKGSAQILKYRIDGPDSWRYEEPEANNVGVMYNLEHEALFRSIRRGQPINDGHYMCNSNMLGIMGRMCTYTGQTLTWDQCFNSQERLGPAEYHWGDDVPMCEVPIPGKAKFS